MSVSKPSNNELPEDFQHERYDPKIVSRVDIAEDNERQFAAYAKNRVEGHGPSAAFRRAFGPGHRVDDAYHYSEQIENNPWYKERFAQELAAMPMDKIWNSKVAINALRQMTLDANNKCATRLAAMKELNVLANITFVDENGKTRAVKGLDDFYATLPSQDLDTIKARDEALAAAGIKDAPTDDSDTVD